MRILYVIDSFGVGGAETLLLSLIAAASRRGHEVHLAYFTPGPLEARMAEYAASVTRLSQRGLKDPRALLRIWSLIRRVQPDVVHTHLTKSELVGQLAARFSGTRRRVLTLHNTDPWRHSRLISGIYRLATGGVHHVIGVSDEVARHAIDTRSVARHKTSVIRNGVDIARFAPLPLPHCSGLGRFRLAVIGRLQPQKDHDTFLKAVALMRSTGAEVLVIGDGPLRGDLEARAAPGVTFTGNLHDMPAVMQGLDAVVLSSAWEGLPMVLLEAMASARAVISTAVGEVPNVICHGENGLLVPPKDPAALANAMDRLVNEPGLAQRLGRAARATIEAEYSDIAMLDRLFALYGDQGPIRALA